MNKFKLHNPIGNEEIKATNKVLKSGILSGFYAQNYPKFFGGKYVLSFEKKLRTFFKCKYAITVNSWTSGLIAAIGAVGIDPGDEIIVSPFTMSASAVSILHWNAIPIFADIDPLTFCLCPKATEKKITNKTKAIMLVDIAGYPSKINQFKRLAKKYNLKIIIDSAQSIGSKYIKKNKFTGTVGDVGGYSLNIHKHINTGEGGIVVTNNKEYANKIFLIRNHGENMLHKIKIKNSKNIVGYNFRMGEIEAAIGIEQLKKLPKILKRIRENADLLNDGLGKLKGLIVPKIDKNEFTHSYYFYGLKIDYTKVQINRNILIKKLRKEGVPCSPGYLNLHTIPIFKNKIAYGSKGFPWSLNQNNNYLNTKCPVAEDLHNRSFFRIPLAEYNFSQNDINSIVKSFYKIWNNLI